LKICGLEWKRLKGWKAKEVGRLKGSEAILFGSIVAQTD